jgi:transcription termination/antitermination protein NusG
MVSILGGLNTERLRTRSLRTVAGSRASSIRFGRKREWVVLRTRSRQEKAVARQLAARGIRHFLPLVERAPENGGRRPAWRVPVFPGYVFLKGQLDDAYDVVSTGRVCQIIPVADQSRFVREIAQIRRALKGEAPLKLFPFAVSGKKCRITHGPFAGLVGVILERVTPTLLVLQVDVLGQGLAMQVDGGILEPVE